MLARNLAEQVPVVTLATTGAEAVRMMAEYRLPGLIVEDRGRPVSVIPGSQLLALIVPRYISENPNLAHVYDEQSSDELCGHLNDITIGRILEGAGDKPLPSVLPEDTVIEVAALMLHGHYPIVCVVDRDGTYSGVVTMSRLMAHIAQITGQDSPLLRRRLERDIIDRALPWDPTDDGNTPPSDHSTGN